MLRTLLISALAALPAFAQAPLRLTLKQAVEIATAPEGNTRVKLVAEAVDQANARSAQARAALLPNVDASVSQMNQTRNLAAMGIRIDLPIPGFSFPGRVGPFNTFDARISGTQTIFDFGAIRRLQASRAAVRASEAEGESTRDEVAAQVAMLYVNALAARAHVEAAESNVSLAEALARTAENRRKAGTGTGIESTRAEVQLANERQRLLVARNQFRQAQLQLLRGMGVSLGGELELADPLEYRPVEALSDREAVDRALTARADWKAQQRRQESARLSYSGTKFERLPSLAGFADYGSIGNGFGSAVPTRTYGVALRVPLFDGGRRDARRSESLSQFRAEQIRTDDLKSQIDLEVRLALDAQRSAEEQVKVAVEGLSLAEREVEQARRRYEAGVANSIEPTDAQTRLERARDNHIAALAGYNIARIHVAQSMGNIRQVIQ
ncbi:MAG TPA: TolC family protein [Bryobacteraceae bacterium]|nr:TolC family protein [Bryobacteraceae bacterium]